MKITGTTRLGGLLGSPVKHSISPMMHNDSFEINGIDAVYLCFDVGPDRLGETVQALRDMNAYGFNLTMPDKEAVIPFLDELSDAARLIGAVNTVENRDGRLIGHNTDGIGFVKAAAAEGIDVSGRTITLLGAGGAGGAIAVQLALSGCRELYLCNRQTRSWNRAGELVERIDQNTPCQARLIDLGDESETASCIRESSLLINATPVGMEPNADAMPLPEDIFGEGGAVHEGLAVADVIYHPRKTKLLRKAEEAGLFAFSGMYMLLYQGEAAFRIWTGTDMPVSVIRERYFAQ